MINYRTFEAGPRINGLIDKLIMKHSQNGIVPDFSGSMDLAWTVVRRLNKDGFALELFAGQDPDDKIAAIVSFICSSGPCRKHGNKLSNHHGVYDVRATTVPLAICRAALVAWPKEKRPARNSK